jgi:hypothetical protein
MENSVMDILKMILQYAIAPLVAFIFWQYKKLHTRVDVHEQRIAGVEKSTAVIQVMVDTIREDIRDIKHGIEKLAEKRQ